MLRTAVAHTCDLNGQLVSRWQAARLAKIASIRQLATFVVAPAASDHPFGNQAALLRASDEATDKVHGFASLPHDRFALLEDEEAAGPPRQTASNCRNRLVPGIRRFERSDTRCPAGHRSKTLRVSLRLLY